MGFTLNSILQKLHILIGLVLVQNIISNNEDEGEKDYDTRSCLKNVYEGSPLILAEQRRHGPLDAFLR